MTLASLQQQAITLYRGIARQSRLLEKDRIRLGRLFIRIRKQFWTLQGGKHRGRSGGQFTTWLLGAGLNAGTVYVYIQLAQTGKDVGDRPSRLRITFWQEFAKKVKKASPSGRVALLRGAVSYLVALYEIPAKSVILEKK